jgi:hypothetical protein
LPSEHASDNVALAAQKWPAGQSPGAALLAGHSRPAGQPSGWLLRAGQYRPVGHVLGAVVVFVGQNVPPGHSVEYGLQKKPAGHTARKVSDPGGQIAQACGDAESAGQNEPPGQGSGATDSAGQYAPPGQDSDRFAPTITPPHVTATLLLALHVPMLPKFSGVHW